MALGDLAFDFSHVKTRLGRVFVTADEGTTWVEVGRCRDVQMRWEKVVSPKDQNGREKQLAADITGTAVLTQTEVEEFDNIAELLHPTGNGLWVKFTEVTATTATAGAAAGAIIKNALFTANGTIDYGGNESFIELEFTGRVSAADLAGFGTDQEIVFG